MFLWLVIKLNVVSDDWERISGKRKKVKQKQKQNVIEDKGKFSFSSYQWKKRYLNLFNSHDLYINPLSFTRKLWLSKAPEFKYPYSQFFFLLCFFFVFVFLLSNLIYLSGARNHRKCLIPDSTRLNRKKDIYRSYPRQSIKY